MSKAKEMDVKVKFGLKSFITVVAILLAVATILGCVACSKAEETTKKKKKKTKKTTT